MHGSLNISNTTSLGYLFNQLFGTTEDVRKHKRVWFRGESMTNYHNLGEDTYATVEIIHISLIPPTLADTVFISSLDG